MSLNSWPDIPGPLFGPTCVPTTPVLRTDMDSGRARQRLRFTQTMWTYSVSMFHTDAEYATFLNWWKTAIHQGADWFTLTLMGPSGVFTANARFVNGVFKYQQRDGGWSISASIEIDQALPE